LNKKVLLSAVAAGLAAMAIVVPAAMAADSGGGGAAAAADRGTVPAAAVRVRSGAGFEGGQARFGFRRGHGPAGFSVFAAAAEQLGMTVEELRAALTDGTSILDLAKAKGLDPDAFTASVVAAVKAEIESAVTAGDLTREQADRILEDLEEHVAAHLAATHQPGEHGRGGCDKDGSGSDSGDSQDSGASTEA
jgi:hypothetical protein